MAHFPWTKFGFCFGSNLNIEGVGDVPGDFANRDAAPTAHIYRKTIEFVSLGRAQIRIDDVFNEGEVASLLTTLVYVFRNFRHVSAIGCCLVKNEVDSVERGTHGRAIGQISFYEILICQHPGGAAVAISLRFQIVEHTHPPTILTQ